MKFRTLGSTGKDVSIIGLGCEHLDGKPYEQVKETIDAALESGINILDVFMPGTEVRTNIAKALGQRREDVFIQGHVGSTNVAQQYDISRDMPTVKRFFEELLALFGGYIDFGMMFFIDSEQDFKSVFETEFADYVQTLKSQGKIGHIGFSSHNPEMALRAIQTGLPEMLMFSINPAFDMLPVDQSIFTQLEDGFNPQLLRGIDPKRNELYQLCQQKDIGITVMKTLGGGKLISPQHSPFVTPLTVPQCIHYALSRPAVASTLLGCQSRKEIGDAVAYLDLDAAAVDYGDVLSGLRNDFKGNCVYCNHCQPCPVEIDIASVNKYLDIALLDAEHIPPTLCLHYESLPQGGDACIACGQCETRCPFGVPIIQNMHTAHALFTR